MPIDKNVTIENEKISNDETSKEDHVESKDKHAETVEGKNDRKSKEGNDEEFEDHEKSNDETSKEDHVESNDKHEKTIEEIMIKGLKKKL